MNEAKFGYRGHGRPPKADSIVKPFTQIGCEETPCRNQCDVSPRQWGPIDWAL